MIAWTLVGQHFEMFDALGGDLPMLTFFENQFSAGSQFVNLCIDVQQFDWFVDAEGSGITGGATNGDAIGIQGNLVADNAIGCGWWIDQAGVPLGPLEPRRANQYPTKHGLVADEFLQAERLPPCLGFVLPEEHFPRIDANQVLAIPPAVIVSLARQIFFEPG